MKISTAVSRSISALLVLLFLSSGYAGSLEEEAKQEIISFYVNKRLMTKCGHAWYSYAGIKNPQALAWSIIEYQEMSAEVQAQPVQHADKRKGGRMAGLRNPTSSSAAHVS